MKFKKPLIFAAFLSIFALHLSAQENPHLKIAFGLNVIDNSNGNQGPWAIHTLDFNTPFFLGADYQVNQKWSFGVNTSFNKLKVLGVESSFFSMNADANYYFVSNASRTFIDFYGILGGGFYNAFDNTAITINPGLGFNYWFSSNLGVNVTAKGNFAVNKDVPEVRNYYQYNLGLIWRLGEGF